VCNITPLRRSVCVYLYIHIYTPAYVCVFVTGKVDMTRNKVFVLWSVFWVFICHTILFVQQPYPEYKYTFLL
jgi:hypothetical protein